MERVARLYGRDVNMATEEARPLSVAKWPPPEASELWDKGEITDLWELERRFPPPKQDRKRKRGEPEKFIDYLWWASTKKMKKANALYASVYSDRVSTPSQYPIAWTTLRQLQCRELTQQLVRLYIKDPVKANLVQSGVMFEIEMILEKVYAEWDRVTRSFSMSSSAFWVVLIFQQHLMMLRKDSNWSAKDANEAFKISVDGIYTRLEEHLNEKPVHETERHVPTIEPIWYETANRNKDAVSLNVLYKSTKPDIQYNRIRKEYRGGHVWLDPEIMALKEPEYAEKQVDISSYFEQAKAANSGNNKRNSSTAVKEEEAVDSEYQEDDD